MPRSDETNRQIRARRRERILASAAAIFARKGLAATTIADIAAATDMSQGLIYRYFASKDELFAVVAEQGMAGVIARAQEARARPEPVRDRLRWLTAQMVPHQYQQPADSLVIAYALTNEAVPREVRDRARQQLASVQEILAGLIAEGQASGQVVAGNPTRLALLYLATLHGLAALAAFIDEPTEGFPDVESMLRILAPHA